MTGRIFGTLICLGEYAYHTTLLSPGTNGMHSLRAQIGVVPQSPVLFDDTIMNNVRYAKLTATDEEVYEACKAASIHEQILTFTEDECIV